MGLGLGDRLSATDVPDAEAEAGAGGAEAGEAGAAGTGRRCGGGQRVGC